MPTLDAAAVARLALDQGLSRSAAVLAVAIARGESNFRTDALGDTTITDATWGPSVGLWQIRSLKAQRNTGQVRDETRLTDPTFNARSMAAISSNGSNWYPWSVWKNGAYRAHLTEAERGVAAAESGRGGGLLDSIVAGARTNPIVGGIAGAAELGYRAGSGDLNALDWLNPQRILLVVAGAAFVIVGITIAAQEFRVGERLVSAAGRLVR